MGISALTSPRQLWVLSVAPDGVSRCLYGLCCGKRNLACNALCLLQVVRQTFLPIVFTALFYAGQVSRGDEMTGVTFLTAGRA
jgi:hypothetical protein